MIATDGRTFIHLGLLWISAMTGLFVAQLTSENVWVRHSIAVGIFLWNIFWTRIAFTLKGDIRNPPPVSFFLANQVSSVALYTITLFFYNAHIVLQIRSWWSAVYLGVATSLVVLWYCRSLQISRANAALVAALMTLTTLEFSWTLSLLPFGAATTAILHIIPVFLLLTIASASFHAWINGKLFIRRICIAASACVLILILTRWS